MKLKLEDSPQEMIAKMTDGNIGAIAAMMQIMENCTEIDPQNAPGLFGILASFDDMELYGTDIYVLWSDKCGRDVRRLLMLMRAVQLGFFDQGKFIEMGKDQSRQINLTEEEFADLDKRVCEELEEFAKPECLTDEQEPDYVSDEAERKAAALDCPEVGAIEKRGVTY